MLLVVLGAGASYDSDPDRPPSYDPTTSRIENLPPNEQHRPPLANRLFDNRPQFLTAMQRFPDCLALIPHLRRSGVAVEKELSRLQAEASTYPERYRQLAAVRYYLHFALGQCQDRWRGIHGGVTNYLTFVDEIERWRYEKKETVCFVTFNYDTMLEEAMQRGLRLAVGSMDSYRSWQDYSLFKLHGSISWGRVVDGITDRPIQHGPYYYQRLIDMAVMGNSYISERYELCDLEMNPRQPGRGMVLFPALSIPLEQKDEFSCPSEHITALESLLPRVTKLITIGWRATEAEFLNMLLASTSVKMPGIRQPLELLVITGSEQGAEETVKNLNPYRQSYNYYRNAAKTATGGFTGLINDLSTLNHFLREAGRA